MKKHLLAPFLGCFLAVSLAGCGDTEGYSAAIRYLARTDPLVLSEILGEKEGETYPLPDPPGQLPILSIKDMLDPRNPFYNASFTKDAATGARTFDPERLFKTGKMRDPNRLTATDRRKLQFALDDLFGSPADPRVGVLEVEDLKKLRLEAKDLVHGSKLYRVHCLHCHGVTGDGRGPTARWINPHPRDFRRGLFKFLSVDQTAGELPPSREDLYRTLHQGVENTAMPAFNLLPADDLNALVSYVMHLSIRGRAEFNLLAGSDFNFDEGYQGPVKLNLDNDDGHAIYNSIIEYGQKFGKAYLTAQTKKIKVGPSATLDKDAMRASVQRGQQMFQGKIKEQAELDKLTAWETNLVSAINKATKKDIKEITQADEDDKKKFSEWSQKSEDRLSEIRAFDKAAKAANCVNCHTDYGRKAGFRWDKWGTLVRPRNLPEGNYRGGRRPVDIYYRLHGGIQGSGMNPFNTLSNEHLWDLVNFVQALPYPAMRRELGINID